MSNLELFQSILQDHHNYKKLSLVSRDFKLTWVPKKATILIGVRRSGKSTLAEEFVKKNADGLIMYVNFADDRLHPFELNQFQELLDAFYSKINTRSQT